MTTIYDSIEMVLKVLSIATLLIFASDASQLGYQAKQVA
jgi:hypothetical protein